MAYISQEKKAELAPAIKAVLKKFGLKGSISVSNRTSLVIKVKSGDIDFIGNYIENNKHHIDDPSKINTLNYMGSSYNIGLTGKALEAIKELQSAAMNGNHDNSDILTDYFDVGWYVDIKIGMWDNPYKFTGESNE